MKLQDRRLYPCKSKPGLCWEHEVCVKEKWWKPAKCHWEDGFQDLTLQEKRDELRNMGFSCTSPMRFKTK